MRSIWIQSLKVLHHYAAAAYLAVRGACCHGWYEAFEYAQTPLEDTVCPVKQLIGVSANEKK